jgi:peptide/nickel transport system permease protein
VAAFFARRLLLGVAVLAVVSFGTFALMATKFSSTCTSRYTPIYEFAPPLAAHVGQAAVLYADWLKGIPSGKSFGVVCNGDVAAQIGPAFGHTAALLGLTALLVVCLSLLLGTMAATRAGSALDGGMRIFSYAAWAVPPFVLALMLQSVVHWASDRYGFHALGWSGWPSGGGPLAVAQHLVAPAIALAMAFVGLHSRYLRSSLLVALNAPYSTTARAKGLPERTVVFRHALRNSLATFTSALLLDFGAIFGAALAVDWVFGLHGLGMLLITEIAGVGGGDGPRFLNPYAIETLLACAATLVIASSLFAELAVVWLDPRGRLR